MPYPITFFRRNSPFFVALFLFLNGLNANGAPPLWWQDENYPLIDTTADPQNRGIANIGQAKCMAMFALEALRNSAPMIASQVEIDLVGPGKPIASWEPPATDEEREKQYSPLLLGQLKAIAAPFYTHLHETAPAWLAYERTTNHMPDTGTFFPWTSSIGDDANRAPAAIGQLKSVFSLHFETLEAALNPDLDGDGLTNSEEAELGTDSLKADTDGDGVSDFDENLAETDPFSADTETQSPLARTVPSSAPDQLAAVTADYKASSDGKGLPKKLRSGFGLIGRWDFEELMPPSGNLPFRFDDKTSGNRAANAYGVQVSDDGMVSKAAYHPARNFATIPASLLNNKTTYSVSFWASVSPGSISPDKGTGLFAHHRYLNVTVPASKLTIDVNGVWLQKTGNQITLRAGSYIYNSRPNAYSPPSSKLVGIAVNVASGQLDDGAFHHYVMIRSGAKTTLYVDGEKFGQATYNSAVISPDSYAGISVGRLYGLSPQISPVQPPNPTGLIGKIDRLRVWSRALTASEAQSIYHQDIDEDGLWDITEARTLLWRDNNHNGIVDTGEKNYQSNPFVWQPANSDTDADDLSDIQEQNLGTNIVNPDTDGDLLPDGWEFKYSSPGTVNIANANSAQAVAAAPSTIGYLDPRSFDANSDPDGDGASNIEEYRNSSNPRKKDTDGDGKDDGDEINGPDGNSNTDDGSDPTDATDGGSRRPANELVNFKLGIGDRSGSHSEDYVLNVFRLDPVSGAETRAYTVRSGGFGQYKEMTKAFKNGDSYSFQLSWQGSNNNVRPASGNTPTEGPDYDYHMVVEPQGNNPGTAMLDSFDPRTNTFKPSVKLLDPQDVNAPDDDDDDITNLPKTLGPLRVVFLSYDILEVYSDQIAGNQANKLPTAFYKGESNNPMLMACRTSNRGYLDVRVKIPAPLAASVLVGAREVDGPGSWLPLSYPAVSAPNPTKIQFNVFYIGSSNFYEVVAGFDANANGVLETSEINVTFAKTPKTDKDKNPVTVDKTIYDKIKIVTESEWVDSQLECLVNNIWGTDYTGDLISAFAHGQSTVDEGVTSSPSSVASTQTGISHPVGARWNSSNSASTHKILFSNGTEASNDVEASNAIGQIIEGNITANLAAIKAATPNSGQWSNGGTYVFNESKPLIDTESEWVGINELGYAFGKVTFIGTMTVSSRWTLGGKLEVGSVTFNGGFSDLYDFSYWGGNRAFFASKVQAGHATLTNSSEPDAGKIFFTEVQFNGPRNVNKEY